LGAQTKNTVCFACGSTAYLSPIHADLSDPDDLLDFEKDVRYFLKKKPAIIACDLHPEYQSTKYASKLQAPSSKLRVIQHHHAHIASCMCENGLKNERVIGVAFDGTGLGSDNTLWGAEFLVCDYKDFKRSAHLVNIPLLGGEAAIREPWRVAAAWLYKAFGEKFLRLNIGFTRDIHKKKWAVLKKMYDAGLNSPPASSMGRFWDAAASIILEDHEVWAEAALAIKLEKIAGSTAVAGRPYHFNILKQESGYIIDPLPLFREMVEDIKKREPRGKIAYRFHLGAAQMLRKVCLIFRQQHKINRVALSGGVFQNNLLLRLSSALLYKEGFQVFTHKKLSCNDSGVSLGQAVIAGSAPGHIGLAGVPLWARS